MIRGSTAHHGVRVALSEKRRRQEQITKAVVRQKTTTIEHEISHGHVCEPHKGFREMRLADTDPQKRHCHETVMRDRIRNKFRSELQFAKQILILLSV